MAEMTIDPAPIAAALPHLRAVPEIGAAPPRASAQAFDRSQLLAAATAATTLVAVHVALHPFPAVFLVLAIVVWTIVVTRGHAEQMILGSVGRASLLVAAAAGLALPFVGTYGPWDVQLALATLLTATLGVHACRGLRTDHELDGRRTLVVGPREQVQESVLILGRRGPGLRPSRSARGLDVVEVCVDEPGLDLGVVAVTVGTDVSTVTRRAQEAGASHVVVHPGPAFGPADIRRLAWALESSGVALLVVPGLHDVAAGRATTTVAGDLLLLDVRPARCRSPRLGANAPERLVALAMIVLLLPVLLVLAALVRHDSAGPAIFRQQRVGHHGREFTMWKLRTMVRAADHDSAHQLVELGNDVDGALFKLRSDPRITGVGRWLRRYSLDELPQLVNVVRGEMALIGPRPALPDEVARYSSDERRRLEVRPGLTGLWQVSGRSDLTWDETVRLDLHYVDNWSRRLDAAIAWRTVGAVVSHRGAY